MKYLAVLFLLSGCGTSTATHTPVVQIDPQLQPILAQFQSDAEAQGKPVQITDLVAQFVPTLPGETLGECLTSPSGIFSPTIQISQEVWDVLDSDGQQELFYHELGHCVLGRVHRWDENNGIPLSVMSPAFLGSTLYDANKKQYLYELFNQKDDSTYLPLYAPPNTLIPVLTPSSNQ